jgi:hypothetical protein
MFFSCLAIPGTLTPNNAASARWVSQVVSSEQHADLHRTVGRAVEQERRQGGEERQVRPGAERQHSTAITP